MHIIGLTGGTGTGKTTALNVLSEMGALCLDCDEVYHELTNTSAALREAIERRFGSVYGADGRLDRKKLGQVVFSDPRALGELNLITHSFGGGGDKAPSATPCDAGWDSRGHRRHRAP